MNFLHRSRLRAYSPTLSRNLKVLAVLIAFYTIIFHYYLSQFLVAEQWGNVIISAVVLFVVTFASGLLLGAKDPTHKSRADLGFHYHFITYIIVNTIGVLWLTSGFSSDKETWGMAALTIVLWGVGVIVHRRLSKTTIKGLPKGTIFD